MSRDTDASTVAYLPREEETLLMGDLLVHPVEWDPNSYRITPWLGSLKQLGKVDRGVESVGRETPSVCRPPWAN